MVILFNLLFPFHLRPLPNGRTQAGYLTLPSGPEDADS